MGSRSCTKTKTAAVIKLHECVRNLNLCKCVPKSLLSAALAVCMYLLLFDMTDVSQNEKEKKKTNKQIIRFSFLELNVQKAQRVCVCLDDANVL